MTTVLDQTDGPLMANRATESLSRPHHLSKVRPQMHLPSLNCVVQTLFGKSNSNIKIQLYSNINKITNFALKITCLIFGFFIVKMMLVMAMSLTMMVMTIVKVVIMESSISGVERSVQKLHCLMPSIWSMTGIL